MFDHPQNQVFSGEWGGSGEGGWFVPKSSCRRVILSKIGQTGVFSRPKSHGEGYSGNGASPRPSRSWTGVLRNQFRLRRSQRTCLAGVTHPSLPLFIGISPPPPIPSLLLLLFIIFWEGPCFLVVVLTVGHGEIRSANHGGKRNQGKKSTPSAAGRGRRSCAKCN